MSTPKAFSKRMAISGERATRSFRRFETAGRLTPKAFATSVTVRRSGATTCLRSTPPGCGGFFIIGRSSMIIDKIKINDFARFETKDYAPIAADGHRPISRKVAFQSMQAQTRKCSDPGHVWRRLDNGDHVDKTRGQRRGNTTPITNLNEPPKPLVSARSDAHCVACKSLRYTLQRRCHHHPTPACAMTLRMTVGNAAPVRSAIAIQRVPTGATVSAETSAR
jgi:hypothetical protein